MSDQNLYPIRAHPDCLAALARHLPGEGPEVVIRILLRHACDANSYRADLVTRQGLRPSELGLGIRVSVDADLPALIVKDDGIGLTEQQLHEHFGNLTALAGQSTAEAAADQAPLTEDACFRRFVVTVLQLLPFADEITVDTLSHESGSTAWRLLYSGGAQYRIEPGELHVPGTLIQVRPAPAYRLLCDPRQVAGLVHLYGDFLQFPIFWEGRQINTMTPPWHQRSATVADQTAFLRNREPQAPAPLLVIPVDIQRGAVEVRGVLWVPGRRLSLLEDNLGTVDLYWRRMLHRQTCARVLPRWARFVTGIIDCNVRPDDLCGEQVTQTGIAHLPTAIEQVLLQAFGRILVDQPRSFLPVAQRQDQLLKLAALESDDVFELVAEHLLFKTTRGRQTLEEYLAEVVQATGRACIYYHSVPIQSSWSVFRAQDLPLVDTSEGLDEAVLRKYDQTNPAVELADIEQTEISIVEELSGPEYRPLVELFAQLDPPVTARAARFQPTSVAATISPAASDPMRPQLEQLFLLSQITGAMPPEARAAMRRAVGARANGPTERVVHVNMDCPAATALLDAVQAGRHELALQVAEIMVLQARARLGSPVDQEQVRELANELLSQLLRGEDAGQVTETSSDH